MTVVGESLSASSLGAPGSTGSTVPPTGSIPPDVNTPQNRNPLALKVNQEVLTSLHLIKDIRRLEKYQRDFFLKVKESLTHVHVLLDHQLMDMAWSDNLSECEENLLKVSTHVQTSSSAQLADVYSILLHDREKLNNRFQELSVKSSLSEFVVNSRQLLDIQAVRVAAETILQNEKPRPAQGDPSIPVDHTFFLANFCTTSLASSMMASFVPKSGAVAASVQQSASAAELQHLASSNMQPPTPEATHQVSQACIQMQPQQQRFEDMRGKTMNNGSNLSNNASVGSVCGQRMMTVGGGCGSSAAQSEMTSSSSPNSTSAIGGIAIGNRHLQSGNGGDRGVSGGSHVNANGIDGIVAATGPASDFGQQQVPHLPPVTSSVPSNNPPANVTSLSGGIPYGRNNQEPEGNLDKYLGSVAAAVAAAAAQAEGRDVADTSSTNGMYGHELASAISQITTRDDGGGGEGISEAGSKQSMKSHMVAHSSTPAGSVTDPWATKMGGVNAAPDTVITGSEVDCSSGSASGRCVPRYRTTSQASGGVPGYGSNLGGGGQDLNHPNDASSDSISSCSDDGSARAAAAAAAAAAVEMSSKPLSFARIASLNIEKQGTVPLQRPPGVGSSVMKTHTGGGSSNGMCSQQHMHLGSAGCGIGSTGLIGVPHAAPPPSNSSLASQMSTPLHGSLASSSHHLAAAAAAAMMSGGSQGMTSSSSLNMPTAALVPLSPSSSPRFYFDIAMEGKRLGRVIIEVQPSVAPKMSLNFSQLVTGEKGFGYKGCQFFQAWRNESVICGDWEHNSGRGGRAALDGGALFTPDDTRLPCVRGAVGMRRMSKKHSSLNQVASQFRIILANMNTQFTGIFGQVVSGIEALDKVADIGGDGGRPEKTAIVSSCGVYKS